MNSVGPEYYCGTLFNGLGSGYNSTSYFDQCSFPKAIAASKVDVALIKQIDCTDRMCRAVFQSLEQTSRMEYYTNCTLTDTSTSKKISFQEVVNLCVNITTVAPSTAPTPGGAAAPIAANPASPSSSPSSSTNTSSGNNTGTVAVIAVAIVVVVGIVVGAFVYLRARRKQQPPQPQTGDTYLNMNAMEQPPPTIATKGTASTIQSSIGSANQQFSLAPGHVLRDLELYRIRAADVHPIKALSKGAFGEVWLGELFGEQIAIKKLISSKNTEADQQKFTSEILLLSKIECAYVVKFIGVAWTSPFDIMLLTEFMGGGDLRQVLETNKKTKKLTWTHKFKIALNIAEGLVFLHSMDPSIIHRDLKSRNVLLDSSFNAKITDFGIAREIDDSTLTAGVGTYRWIAPEVLQDGHYSESADMFSLGVILSELDTEVIPYSDLRNAAGKPLMDTAIMARVMSGELKPSFSPECPRWFVELAQGCLELDPSERPTAMKVAFNIRSRIQGFI
ncbi:unnamed protein product [Aphanomyces euteiches]